MSVTDAKELLLFSFALYGLGVPSKHAHAVAMVALRSLLRGHYAPSQVSAAAIRSAQKLARACGERALVWLETTGLGNDPDLIKAMAAANDQR